MRRCIPPSLRAAAASAAVIASALLADPRPAALGANLILGAALLAAAWIDIGSFRIPDWITFPLIAAGLLVAGLTGTPEPLDAILGAAMGFAVFALVGLGYRAIRGRDGMGLGDAKLLAAGGAWLGSTALPEVVLLAALAGLAQAAIIARRGLSLRAETMIPFGPAIALAIWLVRLTGGWIWTGG